MGCDCVKEADIASLKSDIKTIFKRMDEQLSITKAVYELTSEVKVMNQRMETLTKEMGKVQEDIAQLKSKPGKHWESVVKTIITAVVGGLVAYALFKLGLKA